MIDFALRWAAAHAFRLLGRAGADRRALYGGAHGLRIVCFHETLPRDLPAVIRLVDFCRDRFEIAGPAAADALFEGRGTAVDQVLFTFDDGLESNFEAAAMLARRGIQAIFFVVPSLIDRSMEEYLAFHRRAGVIAHAPLASGGARGLSQAQVREIAGMGHRIGAHNFAHRDLGKLRDGESLEYEIGRALDGVAALTSAPCRDFAIGFGQPENVSDEAAAYLIGRGLRVYSCHRGLNVPGLTPRFLLRHSFEPRQPMAFSKLCVEGGADRRLADRAREMVRRVGALSPAPPGA